MIRQVILARNERPKTREHENISSPDEKNKAATGREDWVRRSLEQNVTKANQTGKTDRKGNDPPGRVVPEIRQNVILENPVTEWLPEAIEGKCCNDNAGDESSADKKHRKAARKMTGTDGIFLRPHENQDKCPTGQYRKEKQNALH